MEEEAAAELSHSSLIFFLFLHFLLFQEASVGF